MYKAAGAKKWMLQEWYSNKKMELWEQEHQVWAGVLDSMMAGYDTFLNTITDMEMTGQERREKMWDSMKQGFVDALGDMIKEFIKTQIKIAIIGSGAKAAEVAAAQVAGPAVAEAWSSAAAMASLASFGTNAIPAAAALSSTTALAKDLAAGGASEGLEDFTVPPGYPDDSYPIMVESGEKIEVTPSGEKSKTQVLKEQIENIYNTTTNNNIVKAQEGLGGLNLNNTYDPIININNEPVTTTPSTGGDINMQDVVNEVAKLREDLRNKPVANTVVFDDVGMSKYVERGSQKRVTL